VPPEIPNGGPPPVDPTAEYDQLVSRALALSTQMQERSPDTWKAFQAWFLARGQNEGWSSLPEVPYESLKSIVAKLERDLAEL
jgi:hypothetical protein